MIAISCPQCHQHARVSKFGKTSCGSQRLRCGDCKKTWSPQPIDRSMTPHKQQLIEAALTERISQRGIARLLKVGRQTIRAVRQKGEAKSR